ncbi:hypothetical protein Back11_38330 [Paenibacillus baekrokdamisoli]|uniref:Uncharacterized protein n=1 Tax=Paenibacillus baekrokdamisoli TaxID=1712516 RepID=A0A3G9JEQ0_9BACL|nr:HEPN domain-containing protein [Paenibacillus baekrokdamisoli]MBB3068470.1 hypothetical protein [Paenibacillus baekrokdamisoli]BBH22488.1 hypothetical protein Back11_38330 [Paenibacillus baekrokdamisoli]
MKRLDEWRSLSHSVLLNPQYWHDISQRYMESAAIFFNHGMYKQCQSVAEMAVNAMLKAYYLKVNGILPKLPQRPDVWISHVHLLTDVNVGSDLLINVLGLQCHSFEQEITRVPSKERVRICFEQIDLFLSHLSPKVVDGSSALYCSVIK